MGAGTNVQLALAIAARLAMAAHRAMEQDRDVTDEELDAAMDRSHAARGRLEKLAERDGLSPGTDTGNDE